MLLLSCCSFRPGWGGGRGTVVITGMQGEPAAAEASRMLQEPGGAMCSPGKVVPGSRDPGSGRLHRLPWWGGVDSDLCPHTAFLVAAAAALVFHARLWGPS